MLIPKYQGAKIRVLFWKYKHCPEITLSVMQMGLLPKVCPELHHVRNYAQFMYPEQSANGFCYPHII